MIKNSEIPEKLVQYIRALYNKPEAFIPLHEPHFSGNEKTYLNEVIESTFVSSSGKYIDRFEEMLAEYTGSKHAVAVVNGTSALHLALILAGVEQGDEVITQPLTFVATANAIAYTGANAVFVDVDHETMGLSSEKLGEFLRSNCEIKNGEAINKQTGNRIKACVPMHAYGFPIHIEDICNVCNEYSIPVIEDAAESLGSFYNGKHTGSFGLMGIFSFNGNKTITCGGGGAIVTNDKGLKKLAKHISTTAKVPHKWEYYHDRIGYNYRMPNLNAALAVAQLELLDDYLVAKRNINESYKSFFENTDIVLKQEIDGTQANYWLNTIITEDYEQQQQILQYTNDHGVMTRPAWTLMNKLPMFSNCYCEDLSNAEWLEKRIVNLPSSITSYESK